MLWGRSSTMLGTSLCKWSMTCPWRIRCMGRVETSLRDENYSQWSWLVSNHLTILKFSTTLIICTCSATMEMTNSRPSTTSGLILYTTWSMMIDLLWIPCVIHCSERLNTQSLCALISADIVPLMKGILKRLMTFYSIWSKDTLPEGSKKDCWKTGSVQLRCRCPPAKPLRPWKMTWKLLPPLRQRRKTLQPLHLPVILPKGSRRLRQKVKLLLFFLRLLRSLMPTRTRKARAKVGREGHHHPLTRRRYSAITSSIKVDVTKVTSVSTVILRKSMMPRWKTRKVEVEAETHLEGRVREVLHQLDLRRRYVGSGRKVHVRLEANANFYMQTSHHQHLLKEPATRTRRRKRFPSLLIPSLIATPKMQRIIPRRG